MSLFKVPQISAGEIVIDSNINMSGTVSVNVAGEKKKKLLRAMLNPMMLYRRSRCTAFILCTTN